MGNKIADLTSFTVVKGKAYFKDPLFVPLTVNSQEAPIGLRFIDFTSEAGDKACLSLFFNSQASTQFTEEKDARATLDKYVNSLERLFASIKPIGQINRKIYAAGYSGWLSLRLSDNSFRTDINFRRNKAEKESLIEAFWRVLGEYVDALQISRHAVGSTLTFSHDAYVMAPGPEPGKKHRQVSAVDYARRAAGFAP